MHDMEFIRRNVEEAMPHPRLHFPHSERINPFHSSYSPLPPTVYPVPVHQSFTDFRNARVSRCAMHIA